MPNIVRNLPFDSSENDNSLNTVAAGQIALAGTRDKDCDGDPTCQPETAGDDFNAGDNELVGELCAEDRRKSEVGHSDGGGPTTVEEHKVDHAGEGDGSDDWGC